MRFPLSAGVAIAAFALVIGLSLGSNPAFAAKYTIEGVALNANETPACPSVGSANVRFIFDDSNNKLDYAVTVNGLSPDQVTASHIHRAAKGVAGPVIYPLSLVGFTQVSGTQQLTDADVTDLKAGNLYFNVHSKDCPAGFARFQLVMPATAPSAPSAAAAAAAAPIRAPSTGDAGLAAERRSSSILLPLAGVIALSLTSFGAFAVARRRV